MSQRGDAKRLEGPVFTDVDDVELAYHPESDAAPDPGEVVWTWIPFEDDPSRGKDRPCVVVGTEGDDVAVIPLTSKGSGRDDEIYVGPGPWDSEGRPSFAKIDDVVRVPPDQVRREAAALDEERFVELVAAVRAYDDAHER